MHKVLLVEDDKAMQEMWKAMWDMLTKGKQKVVLISAFSLEEAEEKFFAETGLTAIVMDACVPGNQPNSPPLVEKIRSVFAGPIIAVSGNPDCQTLLMAAGCSHCCEKIDLPDTLIRVLGF